MKFLILFLLLATANRSICAAPGWSIIPHDGQSIVRYSGDLEADYEPSLEGLEKLLASHDRKRPIRHVTFWHYFNEDPKIQSELLKVFQVDHPEILKSALKSSGNMHNPKVIPLREHLAAALKKTQTIKSMDKLFREQGYMISDFFYEKFWIDKSRKIPRFHAVISIGISSVPAESRKNRSVKNKKSKSKPKSESAKVAEPQPNLPPAPKA